uniref:Rab-GAP TBC domain-containing protein n=1 Tax=Strigamia maritima TaxID=126957 RepID=T1JAT9_STRMM
MSTTFGYHNRDAIRVKVKVRGMNGNRHEPEYRKFSVDPQITSFEVLQSLLTRAFDVRGEFAISYLAKDDRGEDTYLPVLSDWDLDAAFLGASHPCLRLKVDLKPFEEGLEEWAVLAPVDPPLPTPSSDRSTLKGTILTQMEKTLNLVQRAFNFSNEAADSFKPIKQPMADCEFHTFLDGNGCLIKPAELRHCIYQVGGVEASLRRVVWKHLLNVYPNNMSGKERLDYIKRKSVEYENLKEAWQISVNKNTNTDEMQAIINMVRKDVLRTDRTHKYYAGADDNKNVVALFNLLTTYAIYHPSVAYCQGMSDLASPLLVTLRDESQAYICFCALMKRLKPNFMIDGRAMTLKFQHLSEVLQVYDPEFSDYLKQQHGDDLLFCYRWLLLELKREFAFDDALRMLEVLWSSLPHDPPEKDLNLYEEFSPLSPRSLILNSVENPYTKVRAIRRQSSSSSICSSRSKFEMNTRSKTTSVEGQAALQRKESFTEGETSNDDPQDYFPMTTSVTRELRMDLENLNRQLPGPGRHFRFPSEDDNESAKDSWQNASHQGKDDSSEESACDDSDLSAGDQIKCVNNKKSKERTLPMNKCLEQEEKERKHYNGEILESDVTPEKRTQLKCVTPINLVERSSEECRPAVLKENSLAEEIEDLVMTNSCEEASESVQYSAAARAQMPRLPRPSELGDGNPFMIFLSLTLLLQQRDYIMKNRMDYNELAMHLDKMVRKHDVNRVLHQARKLFSDYCSLHSADSSQAEAQDLNV